jgi:Ni2+-binding GTPase involved in maturation of urease and hydrogenase
MKPGNEKNYDYMAKLLILGDSGVGKTNVLMKLCDNNFTPSHLTTIGFYIIYKALILRSRCWKLMARRSRCRYGILPVIYIVLLFI